MLQPFAVIALGVIERQGRHGIQSRGAGVAGVDRFWQVDVTAGVQTLVTEVSADNVGGMVVAAVFLLGLGLAGVAAWHSDGLTAVRSLVAGGSADAETTAESTDVPSPESTVDPEPQPDAVELTDEEVVVDILEDNEGRMKQAKIVDRTGWSKSKVSMILSEMEDDDEISKLRVGRENIISLRGNEPDAAGSPFDDE
ncbi:MAG: helix-turn-helix transcriptional regulator [Haloarculaceae archaeon]